MKPGYFLTKRECAKAFAGGFVVLFVFVCCIWAGYTLGGALWP